MEEQIVIVGYKPKAGKEIILRTLLLEHHAILLGEGLVTERLPIIMQAKDGSFIEVFGWKSKAAIEQAHTNAVVQKMWVEYSAACDYVPIAQIAESADLFSSFMPVI
jgi:hypothetical protein